MERLKDDSTLDNNQLIFPGYGSIPQLRVILDHFLCPFLGLFLIIYNINYIKSAAQPWVYGAYFIGESVILFALNLFSKSSLLKYSFLSLGVSMLIVGLFALLIVSAL